MIKDELNIIHRAQNGDAEAFSLLVQAYQGPVYRLALRVGLSAADAEEVAQEALVAAWKGLPRFRGECQFSTWLYQLTSHAAVDFLRREKRHKGMADIDECLDIADSDHDPEKTAQQNEQKEAVAAAMQKLSPEYREILLLRYMQELDYEEIAAAIKAPTGTVKSRLNRAKAQLKEVLLQQGNFFGGDAVKLSRRGDESDERNV